MESKQFIYPFETLILYIHNKDMTSPGNTVEKDNSNNSVRSRRDCFLQTLKIYKKLLKIAVTSGILTFKSTIFASAKIEASTKT